MISLFTLIAAGEVAALEAAPAEWLATVIESRNAQFQTPVMVAAALAQREITDFLITRGADLNAVDDRGKSGHSYLATFGSAYTEQEVRADVAAAVLRARIQKAVEASPSGDAEVAATGRDGGGVVL